jgi:hypothetical protein
LEVTEDNRNRILSDGEAHTLFQRYGLYAELGLDKDPFGYHVRAWRKWIEYQMINIMPKEHCRDQLGRILKMLPIWLNPECSAPGNEGCRRRPSATETPLISVILDNVLRESKWA